MENLGIDGKLLLAQIINFGLFFFIFKRFISAPFSKFLNEEKTKEQEKQKLLDEMKKREERIAEEERKRKVELKQEIDELIKKAKKDAEQVKTELLAQAKTEADGVLVLAKKEINEERTKLFKEVKNKAGEMSMLMINKALKSYLDTDTQKKLTTYIVNNLSKDVEV